MAYSFMVPVEIHPLILLTFLALPRTCLALILAPSNYCILSALSAASRRKQFTLSPSRLPSAPDLADLFPKADSS